MSSPAPFNSDYTATNFVGFSISVDIVSSDQTLGANWQSLSLGSVNLAAQDLKAGGYNRSRFQMVGSLDYGNVTLTRPWTANQSGWIAQWFSAAEQLGPSTVSITVNYLDVQGSMQQATYNFRNAYPVSWTQPDFVAVPSAETPPRITETLTFSHSGFAESGSLAPGIDSAESVQPFKLVVLPGGVSGVASALSAITSWTPGGDAAAYMSSTALSAESAANAAAANSTLGNFPAITFWVPPSSVSISKSADWRINNSPSAEGSGPVNWLGTQPMHIEFDFTLDGASVDQGQGGASEGESVLPDVERLLALCEVDAVLALAGIGTAPLVVLLWGNFVSPVSYVEDVSTEFVRFNNVGEPTRATGHIKITQYPTSLEAQNPTSGGDVGRQQLEVFDGDQLAHLAFRAYHKPSHWRDIADANGICDPLRVRPGSTLIVPDKAALPRRGESGRPTSKSGIATNNGKTR
ncbi:MAG: phage tail protein [Actinomycetota bacterium]|nr:phage tail protein [Actinomycetota bacterium]